MAKLSSAQLGEYEKVLRRRFAQLQELIHDALLRADEERYVELATQVHDSGDESVADLLSDVNLAVIDRELRELAEVEAALQRIAQGSYGTCAECEVEIGAERLRAQATALRCSECQAKHEKLFAAP